MKPSSIYIIVILFLSFFSCNDLPKNVKRTLELAGDNKKELQTVIDHYQTPEDSLKLKATYFLIGNMANKYSLAGKQLENYNVIFDKIEVVSKKNPFDYADRIDGKFHEVDSIWKAVSKKEGFLTPLNLDVKPDVQHITSTFLIENIEYAFKAWELPWSKHLSFEAFCEYILPYRFRDETLTSWRPYVFNKYLPLLDSLQHIKNPVALCDTINKRLTPSWKYSHVLANYPVAMTIENMEKGKMGSCTHQAGLGVFVMRALGVPVVHEQVPHYGNRSLGHDFNAVLDKNDKFLDFEVGNAKMGNVVDTRKSWNYLIPKIYRQTFSFNEESLAVTKSSQEEVPPYFKNLNIMDVSAQYLPVSDIAIELTQPIPEGSNHVYLCVFDNKNWKAISWAKINNKKATFKDMGLGFAYMPMYFNNQRYLPAASPITLDDKEELASINLLEKEQTILLERKYPPAYWLNRLRVKGKFQAANDISFKGKVNLYEVDAVVAPVYQEIKIEDSRKYRYIRYLFPTNSTCNIAEMSFSSESNIELQGKVITSENIADSTIAKKAFDDDVLSFVNIKNRDSVPQWVGLDFGTKKRISKISFCPRTDKNNVWKGLNYELFYWDKGWISLGIKKAESDTLNYTSPVSNAVFLLKCLDEGKEERIFTYENDKQVWW